MYRPRIIPCLLLRGNGLYKTKKFRDPTYIGDPVNTMRIFSEKEVDEIIVLDITASIEKKEPNYNLVAEMASEAFMPMAYGGGVKTLDQIRKLIRSGIEKVIINTAAIESTDIIKAAADTFGSQAVIAAVDVKKNWLGQYHIHTLCDIKPPPLLDHIQSLTRAGAGEIFINSTDRDGLMQGYDISLLRTITSCVSVPVIACGGAGNTNHLKEAIYQGGVSAVAAGSMFVFHGKHQAVLISYPEYSLANNTSCHE